MYGMDDCSLALSDRRIWLTDGDFGTFEKAFTAAERFVGSQLSKDQRDPLTVIGDFNLPPSNGAASRDFQTLHFDFGLPLDPKTPQDVARYTALYIARGDADVTAVTRLVPLVPLLAQRDWPERAELICRLRPDSWLQGRPFGLFGGELCPRHRRDSNEPTATRQRKDSPRVSLRNGVRHPGSRTCVLPPTRSGCRGR
jgi:hypothetical protein